MSSVRRSGRASGGGKLLTVLFALGMLFLVLPIIVVVFSSFTAGGVIAFPPDGWSFKWYGAALERLDFIAALGTSMVLAVVVTAVTLVLGALVALPIVRGRFRFRQVLAASSLTPLFVPNVVIGFAALPIMVLLGLLGTIWAVMIVYVIIIFPLVVRSLIGAFESANAALEDAARVFGAPPARAFLEVTARLALRGFFAAAVFAFVTVLDEAVIINFIGGNDVVTFPMRFFTYLSETYDPVASVYATVMIVFTTATMLVLNKLIGFDQLGRNLGLGARR